MTQKSIYEIYFNDFIVINLLINNCCRDFKCTTNL